MRNLIFVFIMVFSFYGCKNSSNLQIRSIPSGAKVYDTTSKKFLGNTPLELTYIYDTDPRTPECEVLRPLTAVWGNNDAMRTESDLVVCQNKDYKITLNQSSFRKPLKYKTKEENKEWVINPYIGLGGFGVYSNFDRTSDGFNDSIKKLGKIYKLGFIDNDNNRLEINYNSFDFYGNDAKIVVLDTVVPVGQYKIKDSNSYFKLGWGYASYSYENEDYSNPMFSLGLGVLSYITKDMEVDIGIAYKENINVNVITSAIGIKKDVEIDSELDLMTISMGLNYKF